MALLDFDQALAEVKLDEFIELIKPPKDVQHMLEHGYRIENQSVILFSLRPSFKDPSKKTEEPIAKTTYTKSTGMWKIYWMRADMKWHRYEPVPEVELLDDFLAVIEVDEFNCFWG